MTEKELIGKIRKLRQIRPRKDWVLLTKTQILGEEIAERGRTPVWAFSQFRLSYRPVFISLLALIVLMGTFGFAQNSLPGDILYPIKRITERSRAIFVSQEEQPELQLELTNKRLEELNQIAQTNQVKNLAPALSEFEKTKITAKKEVVNLIKNKPKEEAIKVAKDIAPKLADLNEKEKKVYATLNIESTEESNQTAEKAVVEILIKDAENSTLTDEQKLLLEEAKVDFSAGNYSQALEKILILSYPKE